jgi:hypothetical protein
MTANEEAKTEYTVDQLKRVIHIRDINGKVPFSNHVLDAMFSALAKSSKHLPAERVIEFFGLNSQPEFTLGSLVSVYVIGNYFGYSDQDHAQVQRNIAIQYGYLFVVAEPRLSAVEVYFIGRDAVSLGDAVEVFSRLNLLA